jgi:hypothetical protein
MNPSASTHVVPPAGGSPTTQSRRRFIKNAARATAAAAAMPYLVTASKGADKNPIVGEGDHRYEVIHNWPQLPSKYTWQITHNVAVDRNGLVYVIHEGREDMKDHPAIFVFDRDGKFVRAFGSQFQGGGHGLEVITEGSEQFLYVTAYQGLKNFAKLTLTGEPLWLQHAPMDSKVYAEEEAEHPKKVWGRDRFMPTNYAFLPDGGFFLADGYGAYRIHRYDKNGKWLSMFGEPGKGDGQFNTPHGICIDNRPGKEPTVAVCDRANGRLQWFTFEGKHLRTQDGFILPANLDTYKEVMLVPDLSARVTLLDGNNKVLAHLGEDSEWRKEVTKDGNKMRSQPERWLAGKFVHPHDACFDHDGNILVAEWVATGRVTKLKRLA